MLYNPLLQLFFKSRAACSVYQMWRENSKDLKKAEFFFSTTEPCMNLTVHYISGDFTMRSLQTAFFPPQEYTGKAIAQGLREVLAWIVQQEKMVCINGLD